MTAGVQVKPTEALTRRTARKFAISNFLILAVVLLAFIVVLNVWSYMYSYGHIDARSNYQVQTFIDEHQSAEDHTYGLSKSFIPVLYIKTADGELLNLHPTDDIPPADIEQLLEYPAPFGDSTAEVDGRSSSWRWRRLGTSWPSGPWSPSAMPGSGNDSFRPTPPTSLRRPSP